MSRSSLLPALVFFLAACATSLGASPSRSAQISTAGSRPKHKRSAASPVVKKEQYKIEVRRPVDGPAGKDSARRLIARRHFQQGKVFLIRRQWERAIALLLKAYEYWDHPSVLYNLASAYAHLKDPMRARVYLRLYVKATSSDPERLPRLLAKVMEETAVLTVQIREAPPGVEVFVDGRRAGAMSTELVVQPGLRVVEIRLGSQVLR
ncbi:MAG: tetratricopeptide repeat protein, partial [Polyangia bacterium]|nr:tetratricopeptide repeat protein [Polyangia bacterium]